MNEKNIFSSTLNLIGKLKYWNAANYIIILWGSRVHDHVSSMVATEDEAKNNAVSKPHTANGMAAGITKVSPLTFP